MQLCTAGSYVNISSLLLLVTTIYSAFMSLLSQAVVVVVGPQVARLFDRP